MTLKLLNLGIAVSAVGLLGAATTLPANATLFADRDILVEDDAIGSNPDSLARFKDMGDLATDSFYNDQLSGGLRLFPGANVSQGDPAIDPIAAEPSLRTGVGEEFENFFSNPSAFGAAPADIASTWTVNNENALVYAFNIDVPSWSEVELRVGVDNGVFVWLDGDYIFGALHSGGAPFEEYSLGLADLAGGSHVLQVLREDHGGQTGYNIQLRGTPNEVPEPGALALLGIGLVGLGCMRRRRKTA